MSEFEQGNAPGSIILKKYPWEINNKACFGIFGITISENWWFIIYNEFIICQVMVHSLYDVR